MGINFRLLIGHSFACGSLLVFLSLPLSAEEVRDDLGSFVGTYACIDESSVGFLKEDRQWSSVKFSVEKRVVKVKPLLLDSNSNTFNVTGFHPFHELYCKLPYNSQKIENDLTIWCSANSDRLVLNLSKLRYTWFGGDEYSYAANEGDTTSITIGKCERF